MTSTAGIDIQHKHNSREMVQEDIMSEWRGGRLAAVSSGLI